MNRLPLHAVHEGIGASFQAIAGWELPASYAATRPSKEYDALIKGAGIVDLSHWGKLSFTGGDRNKFLNGLLTNDLLNINKFFEYR